MENLLELLKKRRSCRRFTDEKVDEETVCALLKAALMSPSGHRAMPWEFVLVEDETMLQKLSLCKAQGASFLSGAPMAVVVMADATKTDVWIEDCSIATLLLQLAAEEYELGSCWIQVRERYGLDGVSADEKVKELLQIPAHYRVLSLVAIGHKAVASKPFEEEALQWEKVHIGLYGGR